MDDWKRMKQDSDGVRRAEADDFWDVEKLLPELSEDEQEIVRRGRNAKSHSKPRHADLGTYHAATGFEALWGYLYLAGEQKRLEELFERIIANEE